MTGDICTIKVPDFDGDEEKFPNLVDQVPSIYQGKEVQHGAEDKHRLSPWMRQMKMRRRRALQEMVMS